MKITRKLQPSRDNRGERRSRSGITATEIKHGTFIEDRRRPGVEIGARSLGRRGAVRSKHLLKQTNGVV